MNFTLRSWKLSDIDSLVKYANNSDIAKFMTDKFPHPYTRDAGFAFISFATKDNPKHIFAIDVNGEAVGGIGLHPKEDIESKNAELGYWLAEPFWGNGIITKAIGQMLEFGFKTYDINRIFARPFGTNIASQRVLEKSGFTFECKFEKTLLKNGIALDELYYSFLKS